MEQMGKEYWTRYSFFYILDIMEYIKAPYETYPAEYGVWRNMKQRCLNPKLSNYKDYGGRGIKVCEEWLVFSNFLASMGLRPSKNHSIERRNNDGDYEPANCYWATSEQQSNNTRRNIVLTYQGKTQTLTQWAKELNLDFEVIRSRYRYGWDTESILTTPLNQHHQERRQGKDNVLLTYNGETLNLAQWARKLNIDHEVLRSRRRYGWSVERILSTPVKRRLK